MSLEYRGTPIEVEPPDIGFQAAFGFYLGLAVGAVAALAGVLADATATTLLGTFPTVVTATTLVGHVLAKRARGLPERIGGAWRWRIACYLPAAFFVAAALAPRATPLEYAGGYGPATVGFALLLGVAGFGLERLCRNRFVEAITADEPVLTWTYRPASALANGGTWAVLVAFLSMGIGASVAAGSTVGLVYVLIGGAVGVWSWIINTGDTSGKKYYGMRFSLEMDQRAQQGELRAHERGVRHDRGRSSKLIPWKHINGVELTAEELVLERRFRNLRCDREAIDDPEAIFETLRQVRLRA